MTVLKLSENLTFKPSKIKKTRFTEVQIVATLKKQASGIPAKKICREYSISEVTFYNWKSKCGGMEDSDVKRLNDLEEENSRLKCIFAELSMDHAILKDVITNKGWALQTKGTDNVDR
jgi:putative transposase